MVEHHVEGKLGQAGLDVTRCCGSVTRKDVSPVTLTINEQLFLTQLHQCIANGGITMRVVLHGMSYEVGHLVVTSVVLFLHRMQYAALYGFEAIVEMRHRTFKDNVGGIIQEPVLVHS